MPDQRLAVMENGGTVAEFPVSTSRFGVGDRAGTYATPLGEMQIAQKIGTGAPIGSALSACRSIPASAPPRFTRWRC